MQKQAQAAHSAATGGLTQEHVRPLEQSTATCGTCDYFWQHVGLDESKLTHDLDHNLRCQFCKESFAVEGNQNSSCSKRIELAKVALTGDCRAAPVEVFNAQITQQGQIAQATGYRSTRACVGACREHQDYKPQDRKLIPLPEAKKSLLIPPGSL